MEHEGVRKDAELFHLEAARIRNRLTQGYDVMKRVSGKAQERQPGELKRRHTERSGPVVWPGGSKCMHPKNLGRTAGARAPDLNHDPALALLAQGDGGVMGLPALLESRTD